MRKEAKRQERQKQRAPEKARRLEGVKQHVAPKRGSPMLPVPRPAHLKKKQVKDGFTEVEEFVGVDVNGKELFRKTTKQDLPKGFG